MLATLLAAAVLAANPIRVDQVGYPATAQKRAIVAAKEPRPFSVHRVSDGTVVHAGALSLPRRDEDSGDVVQVADFSAVVQPGRYEVRVAGLGVSAPFDIVANPYRDLLRLAIRSYFGQRCGTAVNLGGGYAHPACHLKEAYHRSSGRTGDRPASGGWHDAGDYGRYVVNSGITMGTLLWAWELFPESLNDLEIPETGDGMPDFLDELRWNLRWMLTMQDGDGGVWHKVTPEVFPALATKPHDDQSMSFVIGTGSPPFKSSCATADFAAVMAIAARVYRPHDTRFANETLSASRKAWSWVSKYPEVVFRNPEGVETGEYGDSDCRDERLWAAAELWRSGGDASAQTYFDAHTDEVLGAITPTTPPSWADLGPMAGWTYALSTRGDSAIASAIRQRSLASANAILRRSLQHAYRIPMTTDDYVWGSNAVASNYALQLLVANQMKPNRAYVDAAVEIVHYLLGRNPFSLSWVTGTGSRSVLHPHHRPSVSDTIDAPWPGLLAGGPNRNRQDPVLRALPQNVPPAKMYVDDRESYASNEIAINWNAPLVFALAGVSARPQRAGVAVFRADGFPTVDAPAIAPAVLDQALSGLGTQALNTLDEFKTRLRDFAVLVLPYGSAFPLDAWTEIRDFVRQGGGLVVLGGAPFHQPVRRTAAGEWQLGIRQPTFAHEFLIGPAEAVPVPAEFRPSLPEKSWSTPVSGARTVWELTVRLATQPDMPGEHGSEGTRDAMLRPLVHLIDRDGIPRASPLLEIDRIRGDEAGARWIFAPSDGPLSPELISAIVQRALHGAVELDAAPVHASIEPGETPTIRITVRRPNDEITATPATLILRDDTGRLIERLTIQFSGEQRIAEIRTRRPLKPGLFHVDVSLPEVTWRPNGVTTGFWVRDETLLTSGPAVTVSRDWLRKNGEVFPVNGTTYMASDVHRKFLFEPDPHVWDRDFAQMSRLGINLVRTGIWTGWSRALSKNSAVDEAFLRALDAYVQTAAKHDIQVNFTFFAFLPSSYGGTNPYLDPRALEGQREFLTTIAKRFRGVGWIHYDLINEPSYAPPSGLWSNRPIRDQWEARAWQEWVRARHGEDHTVFRERWQDAGDDVMSLPGDQELFYTQIREGRRPRKVRDFVEFSQNVVADWARQLRSWLRSSGGDVLVTLGQDEGGTWLRSSQQLHAESIDYTCLHPWWQNDDLLASGVFAKVPEKPMLFQESGLMRLEDVSGWPWRSPDLAARVLESKYAYAFASRGGGVIEWAWNINPYMPIDNEAVIGFFRPDGTAKPELQVVPRYARFFRAAAGWLEDFEPDPVIIVIPQVRLFMGRPAATDGFRRTIRLLSERFGIVPTALSDLRLTPERLRNAKLVIVPSVEFLDRAAADALLAASNAGVKVLFTGAITGDSYGEVPPSLAKLGVGDSGRPVQFREESRWGVATFDRNLREGLLRSNTEGDTWHQPLPLEHAREDEPLTGLLGEALAAAGVETHPSDDHVAARLLYAPRAVFAVVVNETGRDARRRVTVAGASVEIPVRAGSSRLVLFNRATGEIIAETGE